MDTFMNEYFPYVFLILCILGALNIEFGAILFMILMGFTFYVALPIFILVCINVHFGGEACFIAILLAIGFGIYYLHLQRRWTKNK